MKEYNDTVGSRDVDEFEEFEEKYHDKDNEEDSEDKIKKDSEEKLHFIKYKPYKSVPFVNTKVRDDLLYAKTEYFARIDDLKYLDIKNFPEYDYTNSIAFEMLIRTKEYNQLLNAKLSHEAKSRAYDKLGVELSEINSFNLRKISSVYSQYPSKQDFIHSYCDLKISDIDNGLYRLIDFYLNQQQIYIIKKQKKTSIGIPIDVQYEVDSTVDLKKLSSNYKNCYIPTKFDYENYQNQYKLSRIDENIPLVALEDQFLALIQDDVPNNIKGNVSFNFTRPLLRFKESAIVDVPINLNFSKASLEELIGKLKDAFDQEQIKAPMNFLYNKGYKIYDWKKHAPFKVTKESMARAFYVYDLYLDIDSAFQIKKNQLVVRKEEMIEEVITNTKKKIKEIENQTTKIIEGLTTNVKNKTEAKKSLRKEEKRKIKNTNKEKERIIKKIKNNYKFTSLTFHAEEVLAELTQKHNISPYMCKQYLKFMRSCIDNLKYKDLITGIETQSKNI